MNLPAFCKIAPWNEKINMAATITKIQVAPKNHFDLLFMT
jgi:hypothetical protein